MFDFKLDMSNHVGKNVSSIALREALRVYIDTLQLD